jgi:hypothetical protein
MNKLQKNIYEQNEKWRKKQKEQKKIKENIEIEKNKKERNVVYCFFWFAFFL